MRLNKFSVLIREGSETSEGYIELAHGQQYTIELSNHWNRRAEAKVEIDGKEIGTFRLDAHGTTTLERSPDDRGRFTFYQYGSKEAGQVGLGNISKEYLGLISVIFTPEKPRPGVPTAKVSYAVPTAAAPVASYRSGGTGLSGHSNQDFTTVPKLNLDEPEQTEIHLRLIAVDEPRPLEPRARVRTTGIPRPI